MINLEKINEQEVGIIINHKVKRYSIRMECDRFTSRELAILASYVKWLIYSSSIDINEVLLRLKIGNVFDMPSIAVLEHLVYLLLSRTSFDIKLQIDTNPNYSINKYIYESFLFNHNNGIIDRERYYEYILGTKSIFSKNHFRRLSTGSSEEEISYLSQDTITFLTGAGVFNEDLKSGLAEVVSELGINMKEHAKSGFITEIHAIDTTSRRDVREYSGKLISITMYNSSDTKLYTNLRRMVHQGELKEQQSSIYRAYEYHSRFFNEKYDENDFFIVSSFQRYISSRVGDRMTSGTGLTKVLQNTINQLEGSAEDDLGLVNHYSYVLSGHNLVHLHKEFLSEREIDGVKQIGFNKSGRYLDDIPEKWIIDRSAIYYNGSVFFLRLFLLEENNK